MNNYGFCFCDTIIEITMLLEGFRLFYAGKTKTNCGTINYVSCELEFTQNYGWYNLTNLTFTQQYVKAVFS
jgi:hypothetical protein